MAIHNLILSVRTCIQENKLFGKKDKLLVAISGGPDSVALALVLLDLGFEIGLAHCNFNLRGSESDEDEKFVKSLAAHHNLPFFSVSFETQDFVTKNKVSIQMVARDLRYQWLEEQRRINNYDFIAVGHHQNDQVETILINITRGCGLDGLLGIQTKNGKIVRPMLTVTRELIEEFLLNKQQPCRTDQSNKSNKYLRNSVRLDIIPQLEKLNPQFSQHVAKLGERMLNVQEFVNHQLKNISKDFVKIADERVEILTNNLLDRSGSSFILFELIRPYGFKNSDIDLIIDSLKGISGKTFFSKSHRLIKDRESLIIEPLDKIFKEISFELTEFNSSPSNPVGLISEICSSEEFVKDSLIACIDKNKVIFPVKIRTWKHGDTFCPLGMRGKKKVSDLLIDSKFSMSKKEKVLVLENGNGDIIWVLGIRLDNRYKFSEKAKEFWKLSISHDFLPKY